MQYVTLKMLYKMIQNPEETLPYLAFCKICGFSSRSIIAHVIVRLVVSCPANKKPTSKVTMSINPSLY